MVNRSSRPVRAWVVAPLLAFVAGVGTVEAQQVVEETVMYEREVFEYPGTTRPDPFRSAMVDGDLGIRLADLSLRGVVHHADPSQSVAFLLVEGSDRRIQAKVGESVGTLRLLAIYPDRVEVVVEELGVARRETLRIQSPPKSGES